MLALKVHLNGQRKCVAGIADQGSVSAIISWVGRNPQRRRSKEEVDLRVGGLDSARGEFNDWLVESLAAGDEVRIRIVDVRAVDSPKKRRPVEAFRKEAARREKAYVRKMAKKYGWKIVSK